MSGTSTQEVIRAPFHGVGQIVRYNWPYYALSAGAVAIGLALATLVEMPGALNTMVFAGVAITGFWLASSLLVSFYVYDLSPLYRWNWLQDALRTTPQTWVSFHAGLDETSEAIRHLFPSSMGNTIDFYDPEKMQEPSIERARRSVARTDTKDSVDIRALPFQDASLDAAFLILSAHEIRDSGDRVRFFSELGRILKAGGELILVEHLRDGWNFAAYGPGVRHFYSRQEWLRTATAAGFSVNRENSLTPFVRCFVLERVGDA
jgi:hypothetical protein